MNLKEKFVQEGKFRWLDVGCGGNFEDGFYYLDIFPKGIIDSRFRDRYFRIDIANATEKTLAKIGKFDLIRMQHTFEHFSFEEGRKVLKNCAELLNKNGVILITVPDLKIHIQKYINDEYKNWSGFQRWAEQRISKNAPNSFYFSVFAHSLLFEQHKWCYDFEGLKYQLEICGEFKDIKEMKRNEPLANTPFTHNRPEEDVCAMAIKI